jgi:hypothetical protein
MRGYVASARIERVAVHPHAVRSIPAQTDEPETAVIDQPAARSIAELLDDWRVAWQQTTFFLFDPESWR